MKPAKFEYRRAESLDQAIGWLAEGAETARPIAGGQSLGPMLNLRLARPELLVDISRIPALKRIEDGSDTLILGAAIKHAAFEDGEAPDAADGLMQKVAGNIAYRAVRNRGTIGGSLAHGDPAGDWLPVMMALGATLALVGASGARQVAAEDFLDSPLSPVLAQGELVESIRIPRLGAGARWGHYKFVRQPGDFADTIACAVLDPKRGARLALAARDQMPILLANAAATLESGELSAIGAAAEADISEAGFGDADDDYMAGLYRIAVERAAREALT